MVNYTTGVKASLFKIIFQAQGNSMTAWVIFRRNYTKKPQEHFPGLDLIGILLKIENLRPGFIVRYGEAQTFSLQIWKAVNLTESP